MSELDLQARPWWTRAHVMGFPRILLFAQAFVLLTAAKLALLFVPVQRVLGWRRVAAGPKATLSAEDRLAQVRLVRWAVQAAVKRSPIEFVCFPQSLAARALLHARGIQTTLYYGVNRTDGKLATHTWLMADESPVTGCEIAEAFSVLAVY